MNDHDDCQKKCPNPYLHQLPKSPGTQTFALWMFFPLGVRVGFWAVTRALLMFVTSRDCKFDQLDQEIQRDWGLKRGCTAGVSEPDECTMQAQAHENTYSSRTLCMNA